MKYNIGLSRLSSICMLLIVMMHCVFILPTPTNNIEVFNYFVFNTFTRVAVPIFFFISGYFIARNYNYKAILISRSRTILCPFILWSIISVGVFLVGCRLPVVSKFFNNYIPLTLVEILRLTLLSPINGALWFLRDLYILVLISPLLVIIVKYRYLKFLFIIPICGVWFLCLNVYLVEPILFFSLGLVISLCRFRIKYRQNNNLVLLVLYFILCYATSYLQQLDFGIWNIVLYKSLIVIGLGVVLYYFSALKECKSAHLIDRFKRYSFFVYASHSIVNQFVKKMIISILPFHTSLELTIVGYLTTIVTTIFICCISQRILRNISPKMLIVLTGGRC